MKILLEFQQVSLKYCLFLVSPSGIHIDNICHFPAGEIFGFKSWIVIERIARNRMPHSDTICEKSCLNIRIPIITTQVAVFIIHCEMPSPLLGQMNVVNLSMCEYCCIFLGCVYLYVHTSIFVLLLSVM